VRYEHAAAKRKFASVMLALTAVAGCHHKAPQRPVSVLNTADRTITKQLVGGFYPIEANAWRWTARQFIVTLLPPPGSDKQGAKLELHFVIPDAQIAKLGPMTLSADVDDYSLTAETYSTGGEHDYTRDIPASLLRTNSVPVIFRFDKASPPTAADGRELGAVVSLIALQAN
jgi:hypothetical protein